MTTGLTGKTALVTGLSRGIGRGIALALAAEGCNIVLTGRDAGVTRFGTPQDVAALVCFIVSKNGSWLHGATIDLDGGEIPVL